MSHWLVYTSPPPSVNSIFQAKPFFKCTYCKLLCSQFFFGYKSPVTHVNKYQNYNMTNTENYSKVFFIRTFLYLILLFFFIGPFNSESTSKCCEIIAIIANELLKFANSPLTRLSPKTTTGGGQLQSRL